MNSNLYHLLKNNQIRTYVEVRETASFILINPAGDINKAIRDRDWFTGFAASVSYFEHFGTIKIRNYLDSHVVGVISDTEKRKKVRKQLKADLGKNLERLGAKDIAFLLYTFGLIDSNTYLDMRKITAERNKLVHPARKGIAWRYEKPEESATDLLQKATDVVQTIQQVRV